MYNQWIRDTGLRWWWLVVLIFILDQVTKSWVSAHIRLAEVIHVLSFFNLTLAHNEGAAFSFLAQAGGWQRWLFTAIALGASVFLLIWLKSLPRQAVWLGLALSLVLSGALGNVYDRITLGYVVDFLDFHWNSIHFPAFNVADSAISVGAVMLAIDMFRESKKQNQGKQNEDKS